VSCNAVKRLKTETLSVNTSIFISVGFIDVNWCRASSRQKENSWVVFWMTFYNYNLCDYNLYDYNLYGYNLYDYNLNNCNLYNYNSYSYNLYNDITCIESNLCTTTTIGTIRKWPL
jgi:uncharacterized protein YjbI with pentapeptide repeats